MTAAVGVFFGVVVLATIGDTTVAALVTVAGTFANTILIMANHRHVRHIRETITAPRRIVYDADGNPIGTVLDLARQGGWDNWMVRRRMDDPPPAKDDEPRGRDD